MKRGSLFLCVSVALFGVLLASCGEQPEKAAERSALATPVDTGARHQVPRSYSPDGRKVHRLVITARPKEEPAPESGIPLDVPGTMVFQEGVSPTSGYTMDGDTVWAYSPSSNYGTDTAFGIGVNGNFAWPYLHFDLSALPSGAQVTQAVLSLYAYDMWYNCVSGQNVSTHKVLSAWNENTLTYNTMPPDWNNNIFESNVYVTTYGRWWDWTVTQMTKDWVANPVANFGLSVIPIDSLCDQDYILCYSDDYSVTSYRPKLTVDYTIPDHRAQFISQNPPPATMTVSQVFSVALTYQNNGADTWTDAAGYHLGSQAPADNTNWGMGRVALPNSVGPGAQVQFRFDITAPATPGSYTFQWQMVHDGVMWFGDLSPAVAVTVNLKDNGQPCQLGSECVSGKCVDTVCCDSTCLGACKSCLIPGSLGNCNYIPSGQDPDHECGGTGACAGSCNGLGACAYPALGTACANCASCDGLGGCSRYTAAGTDPGNVCGVCRVCPGNGPDCVPSSAGTDPFNECPVADPTTCGTSGDCDGNGACAFYSATTVCAPESCAANIHHPASLCDGAGTCVNGGGQHCLPYLCEDTVHCWTTCTDNSQCDSQSHCDLGSCVGYVQRGQPCNRDNQCISGHCTDLVCCDSACQGLCEVCNLAADPGGCYAVPDGQDPRNACPGTGICKGVCNGSRACRFTPASAKCAPCATCSGDGFCTHFQSAGTDPFDDCAPCWVCSGTDTTCRLVPDGQDTANDCPQTGSDGCGPMGTCDGNGNCRLWPASTVCLAASCAAGVLNPAHLCDGAGNCVEGGQVQCSPYACQAPDACFTSCQDDSACLTGFHCEAPQCTANLGPGSACARDGQCASGHCVDSVCCDSDCTGTCRRCDLAASMGTCSFIPLSLDPDSECPGGGSCGGACDGAGGCIFPDQNTACGKCARCDGTGGCTVMVPAGTDPGDACGPCRACQGARDECVPILAGTDPLDECAQDPAQTCGKDGSCDGRGACRLWSAGTACGVQSCTGGVLTRAPTCDGAGACKSAGTVTCASGLCDGINCQGPANLHHVSVENAPGGTGQAVGARTLSTNDTLPLFAVGRDANGGFLADVLVDWQVNGNIGTIPFGPSTSATFDPTTPGTGRVIADYYLPTVLDGSTGDLQVTAGLATGNIPVVANPPVIPPDGFSVSVVTAGPVTDADGNAVADGTLITVLASAGRLDASDAAPALPGLQRATSGGNISVNLVAGTSPARAQIKVLAVSPGTASGEGVVYFGGNLPVAVAGPDQTVPAGALVTLDGSSSFDPLGKPLAFTWTQRQGQAVNLKNANTAQPSFTAPSTAGQQALVFELVVLAAGRSSAPDSVQITVIGTDPDLPVARLTLTPEQGPAPLEVSLDGSASTAASGSTLTDYWWTFADGAPSLSGETASRNFTTPGGVGVELTVQDDSGRFASARGEVLVLDGANVPPTLTITAVPERGDAPLQVSFHAESTDPDDAVKLIEWDFGAGFGPTGPDQAHVFTQPGIALVRARATDAAGLATIQQVTIAVSEGGAYPPKIVSPPLLSATVGKPYGYQAAAIGSRPLTWSLGKLVSGQKTRSPAGMMAGADTGLVTWTPTGKQVGKNDVTLVVQNSAGADFQDFTVAVAASGSSGGCSCGGGYAPFSELALAFFLLAAARTRRRGSSGKQKLL